MQPESEITGGARIGGANATWPLARLRCSADLLSLHVTVFGDFTFTPATVVSLTPYGWLPLVGRGVKITHTRGEYPQHIVFWYLGNPQTVLARIANAGFVPAASADALPREQGIPVRISALLLPVLVWNALFLADFGSTQGFPPLPGPFAWVAMLLAFVYSSTLSRSPRLQSAVLRQGRSFDEIRAPVFLFRLVTGLMLLVLSIELGLRLAWS